MLLNSLLIRMGFGLSDLMALFHSIGKRDVLLVCFVLNIFSQYIFPDYSSLVDNCMIILLHLKYFLHREDPEIYGYTIPLYSHHSAILLPLSLCSMVLNYYEQPDLAITLFSLNRSERTRSRAVLGIVLVTLIVSHFFLNSWIKFLFVMFQLTIFVYGIWAKRYGQRIPLFSDACKSYGIEWATKGAYTTTFRRLFAPYGSYVDYDKEILCIPTAYAKPDNQPRVVCIGGIYKADKSADHRLSLTISLNIGDRYDRSFLTKLYVYGRAKREDNMCIQLDIYKYPKGINWGISELIALYVQKMTGIKEIGYHAQQLFLRYLYEQARDELDEHCT